MMATEITSGSASSDADLSSAFFLGRITQLPITKNGCVYCFAMCAKTLMGLRAHLT